MTHRFAFIAISAAAVSLAVNTLPAAESAASQAWKRDTNSLALIQDGKPVWQFNFATNGPTKPYFHPVALAGGPVLTCPNPPDHPWHYGMWFSWKYINGVNYWEENKQRQSEGTTSWKVVKVDTRPDFSATIELALDYRKAGAAKPVVTERRVVEISAPAADGSYTMDWKLEFQAGDEPVKFDRTPLANEPNGKSYGGYAGLSIRLAQEFTDTKVSATADIGAAVENRFRFRASGADYSGKIGGGEAGFAMLDHPSNPRFPTPWYAIVDAKQPFWFVNAAWLQREPFELAPAKNIRLLYRVLAHPQRWDSAKLTAEAQRFAGEAAPAKPTAAARRILVFTKNGKGYVHENLKASVDAIQKLCKENGIAVDVSDNPEVFTAKNLSQYRAVVFDNSNNEGFDTEAQRTAFQDYIHAGGAFVGIHSACGSERNWPWYWSLLGGKFLRHPPLQPFTIKVSDPKNPSTAHIGETWQWTDEFYYLDHLNPDIHILLSGDLTTLKDPQKDKYPGKLFGDTFPLAWCHEFEGGRAWYTAIGHQPAHYSDPKYTQHILGGILWAMNEKPTTK